LLAVSFIGQDDFERAIPVLDKIDSMSPGNAGNLYLLSRACLQTKRFDKALATFDALERADPNSPWVHLLKGQAYDGQAQYDKSIEEFKAARQQQPNDATVRFSLGFLYWKTNASRKRRRSSRKRLSWIPIFAKQSLSGGCVFDDKARANRYRCCNRSWFRTRAMYAPGSI